MKLLRIALPLALLAACGSDQNPVVGPSSDQTTITRGGAAAASTSTSAGGPTGGFATTTVSTPIGEAALLADVSATNDPDAGVDRITFTFEGAPPGYRVGYVPRPLTEDGSGKEVTVDGAAVLEVRFEPASGFDLSGGGRLVYKGPTRLDLATRTVLDVVRVGDFEANLTWAVGVDAEGTPFRVRADGRTVVLEVEATPG